MPAFERQAFDLTERLDHLTSSTVSGGMGAFHQTANSICSVRMFDVYQAFVASIYSSQVHEKETDRFQMVTMILLDGQSNCAKDRRSPSSFVVLSAGLGQLDLTWRLLDHVAHTDEFIPEWQVMALSPTTETHGLGTPRVGL